MLESILQVTNRLAITTCSGLAITTRSGLAITTRSGLAITTRNEHLDLQLSGDFFHLKHPAM